MRQRGVKEAEQKIEEKTPVYGEIGTPKKIINPDTGKEFGKFLKGKYLELVGSKKNVLFGGNKIVLSAEETTTVTGILFDVNSVARRGQVLEGVTKMGAIKGGINILRSSKWSELLEKYKYLESINKNKYYKKVTDEFWEQVNKPWLDEAIKRGDQVRFVTDPASDVGKYVIVKG